MKFKQATIIACKPLSNYCVWIRFDDGLEGVVDLNHLVGRGVFEEWNSIRFFEKVYVDPETHTLAWNKDIDLDPYVLREQILETYKKKYK